MSNSIKRIHKFKENRRLLESYIFIHDQELLIEFEDKGKFDQLNNYKYIFIGKGDISKIIDNAKVLIANKYSKNLEDYPFFTAFTGWYFLWKNNIISSTYVNLLEYDVVLVNNFENRISKSLNKSPDLIGYVPRSISSANFIEYRGIVKKLFAAITAEYKIDIEITLRHLIAMEPNLMWPSTTNVTIKKYVFDEYMKWFEPLILHLATEQLCGHASERALSFFCLTKNKKIILEDKLLKHFQMNSHGTQSLTVNYEENIEKIINNRI